MADHPLMSLALTREEYHKLLDAAQYAPSAAFRFRAAALLNEVLQGLAERNA